MIETKDKAILIFSTKRDFSTLEVIKWLDYYNKKYFLITSVEDFYNYNLKVNLQYLHDNISCVWYRKLNLSIPKFEHTNSHFNNSTIDFLNSELEQFYFSLEAMLANINNLGGSFKKMDVNKIEVLIAARKCEICVPDFIITSNKSDLLNFMSDKEIITKPIFNTMPIVLDENRIGYMYTAKVEKEIVYKLPELFFPSFFQEFIIKDFEIRSFYLDGKFFSGAIIQQEKDNVDYRDSNQEEIKIVPYNLPIKIKKNITKLMRNLKLNTGSIDLIKTKNDEYFFLEVNPCGQYEAISVNCNFQLNKRIAEWLIK